MLKVSLSTNQMSPLTRNLIEMERGFLKPSPSYQTITDTFRTTIVGRALTFGVSLILHTEAICRAVYIAFLSIKAFFSMARGENKLIDKQVDASRQALRASMISMQACFQQRILHQSELEDSIPSDPVPFRQPPLQLAPAPALVMVQEPIFAPAPDPVAVVPLREPIQAGDQVVLGQAVLRPNYFEQTREEEERDLRIQIIDLPDVEQPNFAPRQVESEIPLLPDLQPISDREFRVSDKPEKIKRKLQDELRLAQNFAQTELNKQFHLQSAPNCLQVGDRRYQGSLEVLGHFQAGICRYTGPASSSKGSQLATEFSLIIGSSLVYPVKLFGVFDSLGGSEASRFIKDNIREVVIDCLKEMNPERLTELGIRNALKITFARLNQKFLEENKHLVDIHSERYVIDQGASAILSLVLDGRVWTASLGNGRAILRRGDQFTSLNSEMRPQMDRFEKGIRAKGGTVENDLVCGSIPVARAIGVHYLHEVMSSRPKITATPFLSGDELFLASAPFFAACSSREVVKILAEQNMDSEERQVTFKDLAFDLIYSALPLSNEKSDLACVLARGSFEPTRFDLDEQKEEVDSDEGSGVYVSQSDLGIDNSLDNFPIDEDEFDLSPAGSEAALVGNSDLGLMSPRSAIGSGELVSAPRSEVEHVESLPISPRSDAESGQLVSAPRSEAAPSPRSSTGSGELISAPKSEAALVESIGSFVNSPRSDAESGQLVSAPRSEAAPIHSQATSPRSTVESDQLVSAPNLEAAPIDSSANSPRSSTGSGELISAPRSEAALVESIGSFVNSPRSDAESGQLVSAPRSEANPVELSPRSDGARESVSGAGSEPEMVAQSQPHSPLGSDWSEVSRE